MSLRKIERRRVPTDRWFRTTAKLNSIIRAMSHYDEDAFESMPKRICDVINETSVPIWVRMEKYKAMETKAHPDGMIWGPVITIGTMNSPDVQMFGYHHNCGLFRDGTLDGHSSDEREDGGWIYYPYEEQCVPYEDVSVYECDICHEHCYRDDFGIRWNKSATIFDGGLVCRDCEVHGLIAPADDPRRRWTGLTSWPASSAAMLFARTSVAWQMFAGEDVGATCRARRGCTRKTSIRSAGPPWS